MKQFVPGFVLYSKAIVYVPGRVEGELTNMKKAFCLLIAASGMIAAGAGNLPQPPMKQTRAEIKWAKTICSEKDRYVGWPTVCRLKSGDVLVVFSGDRDEHICPYGKLQMIRSQDEGETWSEPETIANSLLDDRDAGIMQMPDGEIIVTWFTSIAYVSQTKDPTYRRHHGKLPPQLVEAELGYFLIRSKDDGKTWSKPEKLANCDQTPHGPILLKDGSLLQIGRRSAGDKDAASRNVFDKTIISASHSTDGGRTWEYLCLEIPCKPEENSRPKMFHEPHVAELADGTLVGLVRYHGNEGKWANHRVKNGYMRTTFSKDGGRTWTRMEATPLLGLPPHLLLLPDGKLVCVYGRRIAEPNLGEFACISDDGGKTWDVENEIMLMPGANYDLGYPSSCLLGDGDILTVYYQHPGGNARTVLMATRWRVTK